MRHMPQECGELSPDYLDTIWSHLAEVTTGAVLLTGAGLSVLRLTDDVRNLLCLDGRGVEKLRKKGLEALPGLVKDPVGLAEHLAMLSEGSPRPVSGRIGLDDGRTIHYSSRSVTVTAEGCSVRVWTFTDAPLTSYDDWFSTERQETLRSVIESLGEGIALIEDGSLVYMNHKMLELLGRSREELAAIDPMDVVAPADRESIRAVMSAESDEQAAGKLFECWIERPDGERRFIQNRVVRMPSTGITVVATTDITDEKTSREALRESEKQYRATIDAMTDAIHVIDRDLRIVLANESTRMWTGSLGLPEPAPGMHLREVFPFLGDGVFEEYRQVMAVGRPLWTAESTRVGGETRYTETLKIPVREGDSVSRIVTVLRDVSEEVRLRKVDEAIREIAQAALATRDLPDLYRTIHRVIGDLMPADNFFIALYHPEDDSVSFPYFVDKYDTAPVKRSASVGNTGYVIRTGRTFWADAGQMAEMAERGELVLSGTDSAEWIGVPLRLDDRTVGVLTVQTYTEGTHFSEVHVRMLEFISTQIAMAIERRHALASLEESEEKYRTLVERGSDGIAIVRDNEVLFINSRLSEMLGYDESEAVGRDMRDFLPGSELPKIGEYYQLMLEDGNLSRVYETILIHRDGSRVPVELNAGLIGFEGRPATQISIRDISERRRAEMERKQLEAQIQHAQKLESLGLLAGGVAHDFNNLLMGILGNAGLALMEMSPESPARKTVERIETASLRAAELTSQLLAYSGKGKFVVEPIDLSRLVEEMGHLLRAVIGKNVALRFDFGEDVPAVEGDATQLRQIVMNLIMNASEAIGDGEGVITVTTGLVEADESELSGAYSSESMEPGPYARLEIADDGCGMSEETIARMFDPFFSTKFSGRGLGLAAVLGIVRSHRGAVSVESGVGIGTTFRILLPISDRPIEEAVGSDSLGRRTWEPGGTVLIADDEETVRTVTRLMLEKMGFSVMAAGDGREAVEMVRDNPGSIDLVLLDMTMPRMGGEEAFAMIRELEPDLRVILCSGYSEEEATSRFSGKGLSGFLQKPYRPVQLMAAVEKILGQGLADPPHDS